MNYHDTAPSADGDVTVALGEDYPELRQTVRQICEGFPGEYWRKLDAGAVIRPSSSRR